MNKSVLLSLITLYGAATVGCADDVVGRAPKKTQDHFMSFWLGF